MSAQPGISITRNPREPPAAPAPRSALGISDAVRAARKLASEAPIRDLLAGRNIRREESNADLITVAVQNKFRDLIGRLGKLVDECEALDAPDSRRTGAEEAEDKKAMTEKEHEIKTAIAERECLILLLKRCSCLMRMEHELNQLELKRAELEALIDSPPPVRLSEAGEAALEHLNEQCRCHAQLGKDKPGLQRQLDDAVNAVEKITRHGKETNDAGIRQLERKIEKLDAERATLEAELQSARPDIASKPVPDMRRIIQRELDSAREVERRYHAQLARNNSKHAELNNTMLNVSKKFEKEKAGLIADLQEHEITLIA